MKSCEDTAVSNTISCRISSVGRREILLMDENGREVKGRISGRIYKDGTPVVGDRVTVDTAQDVPIVVEVFPRRNTLKRTVSRGEEHIIAANIDMVLVMISLRNPPPKYNVIKNSLIGAEWQNIPVTIVLNKIDLVEEHLSEEIGSLIDTYGEGGAGYPIFPISCISGDGVSTLRASLKGKTVVISGPSGSGKTSFAKILNPSLDLLIGEINTNTSQGRHTTVAARLITLDENTFLIDTPGVRVFPIEHIPFDKLQFCFPEFREFIGDCRFRDCLHRTEPGCAVKKAVQQERIKEERYDVYLKLVNKAENQ